MHLIPKRRLLKRICLMALRCTAAVLFLVFGVLPLVFRYSHTVQRFFVFLNFIQWPQSTEIKNPEVFGIEDTRNFFIKTRSNITNKKLSLGTWHILPLKYMNWSDYDEPALHAEAVDVEDEENALAARKERVFNALLSKTDKPVILYAHGNANNRACFHRVQLYKLLQSLDYHVIAFDYRSYGDSTTMEMSELGVVEDLLIVYNWILEKLGQAGASSNSSAPVFIWGHSLGTGISNHALALIAEGGNSSGIVMPKVEPNGLILEAPFNNFYEELQGHFLGKLYSWLPWFHWSIVDPVVDSGLQFKSDVHIGRFSTPVLILHAEEDKVVPYELGVKLFQVASSIRPQNSIEMITFDAKYKLGHKNIYQAADLPQIISNFVRRNSEKNLQPRD